MIDREAVYRDWQARIQDWETDVASERRPHVRQRKAKALDLLRQGIDPYPTLGELRASKDEQDTLRKVRLGQV